MLNKKNKESRGAQVVVVFWLFFIIVIISIFIFNAKTIKENFNLFKLRMTSASDASEEILMFDDDSIEEVVIGQPQQREIPETQSSPAGTAAEPAAVAEPDAIPHEPVPAQPGRQTQPQTQPQTPVQPQTQAAPLQTRDRSVYFTQVNNDGQILQSKATRRIPVSQSPMTDALNVLLAGPSAEELSRGLINLIPANTRMLSAIVRGSTAYINFSVDFLFNTFGVEGYVAQLRQIVWTATEFSNVNDVQILIEGRRIDYLGEGIWIGSPISRQSF